MEPGPRNKALGDFLRARRALVDPREVGFGMTWRRRVNGLRREEMAQLANISVHYYTHLEQGKHPSAPSGVLDAIATALLLPTAERAQLHRLAGTDRGDIRAAADDVEVRPETIRLLDALGRSPSFVLAPNMDILAANAAAVDLCTPPVPRNAIHWLLFHPDTGRLFGDGRTEVAAALIAILRRHAGRRHTHPGVGPVVEQLAASSEFFRRVWAEHVVSNDGQRLERSDRAGAGAVETLAVKLAEDRTVLVFIPSGQP